MENRNVLQGKNCLKQLPAEVLAVTCRDPAMKAVFLESGKGSRSIMKTLLQKAIDNKEINPDPDPGANSSLLFAPGDGLIICIADDSHFNFDRKLKTFESAVRSILLPKKRTHGENGS